MKLAFLMFLISGYSVAQSEDLYIDFGKSFSYKFKKKGFSKIEEVEGLNFISENLDTEFLSNCQIGSNNKVLNKIMPGDTVQVDLDSSNVSMGKIHLAIKNVNDDSDQTGYPDIIECSFGSSSGDMGLGSERFKTTPQIVRQFLSYGILLGNY